MGAEAEDISAQVPKDFIAQGVDEGVDVLGGLEAEAELAGTPFLEGGEAGDVRESGFVRRVDVTSFSDDLLDEAGEVRAQGAFMRREVEEVEGEPVIHGGEEMGLAEFEAAVPERAADRGGESAIIACRHADDGGPAVAEDAGLWAGGVWFFDHAHEVGAEAVGVLAIDPAEEVLAEIPEDVELFAGVTGGAEQSGVVGGGMEPHHRLVVELADVEPAGGIGCLGFPFDAVGAGEDEKRPQEMFVLTKLDVFVDLEGIVHAGFGTFLEGTAMGDEEFGDADGFGAEVAFSGVGAVVIGEGNAGEPGGKSFMQGAGPVTAHDFVIRRERQAFGLEGELYSGQVVRIQKRGFDLDRDTLGGSGA